MDEYDELLAKARGMATAVPVMPETAPKLEPADEFDQLLAKARQPDLSKSQAAVFNGSFSNPAAAAEKINLSASIKKMLGEDIPPSIIDPAEDKRRIRQAEMDHALRNSAGLQKWIDRDPENAGLLDGKGAKDLAFIDTVLNYGKRGVGTLLAGAFADPAAATYTNLALPFKLGEQALTMAGLPEWAAQSEIAKALMWAARESKKTGDMLAGPPGEGNLEAGVFSGIRSLGGNLTTMFGGKLLDFGAKATTAAMSSVQGGQSALKALDEGKSASTATLFGLADTAAEYATELPGMKALLSTPGLKQGMMAFLKKAGEFGIKEMGGEQVATVWQDFNEWALINPDKPFQEYLDARPDAAIQTAIATIIGGGGQIAVQQMMVRGRQQEQKAIFDALHAGAENSELLKNVPDKYREFVKNATEDGGIKDVFIPADKFVTYFQGRDLDPAMVAQDLGITNFTEAVEAGSDVMVPMDSFATMIAGSEHYDGLSQDLRLHQGDMTAREAQLEEANREESGKALEQSIQQLLADGEKAKGLNAAIDTIVTDIEGQLIGAGVDRSAAKTQAQLLRGVAVMAQRAFPNEDPVQAAERIWGKYNLKVNRDMPAVLKHLKDTDLEIDPLLDALRGKGPQQDSVIFGESLLEFLRGKGGLQPVGELTDAASYPTPPGQKKLISELGKKLDEAAMAAVEAGYFPGTQDGNLTETELVEAILNELGGSPTYSMNNTDEAAMGKKAAMEMLDKAIKDAGIDLNAVTDNAEVRRLLELAGPVTGAMFDQPKAGASDTANAWFESQVRSDPIAWRLPPDTVAKRAAEMRAHWEKQAKSKSEKKANEAKTALAMNDYRDAIVRAHTHKNLTFIPLPDGAFSAKGTMFVHQSPAYGKKQGSSYRLVIVNGEPAYAREADHWGRFHTQEWRDGEQVATDYKWSLDGVPEKNDGVRRAGYILLRDLPGGTRTTAFKTVDTESGEFENLFFQPAGNDARGYIQIGPDRQMRIGLTESANLSTFAHETGHFYLEMLGDLAETEGVSQEVKDDYARILKFLGVTTRAEIGTEQHEKWARANEAYLREGKSPAPELQGVFQRFKAWLKQIYSSIDKLDVTLSNEVRDVFDRIYASDQEIAAARDQVDIAPLFLDAEAAGMTEAEFKNYAREVGQVSDEAKDKLLAKLMKEYQRGKEQWWKDELAKVSKEVAAEIDAMPVYQAFAALTSGKLPDGTPIKLNRDELADRFTPDFIQKLPRGLQRIYAANGGMAVDTAAEILGYASGNDLIKAISEMRPRKELIEAEARQRMADLHGDMLLDGSIENEAQVALHNDKRADMLMIELRALRRRQRDVKPFVQAEKNKAKEARSATLHALDTLPSTAAFRAAAAGRIDQTAVRDLNPGQYLIAGQKAAREAAQALARQDPAAAVVAKQRELLNHYLYLEATKAKAQAKRIAEYAKGFDKASRRQALAKAGKGYLEQIDALLEQFEFKNVSLRTIDRRKSLADFIAEKEAEGETFAIPQHLIDDSKVQNWRQASMMELRGLEDALRNLAHLAAYKNKLLRKKAALDFDKIKVELLDSLNGSFKDSTGELSKLNDKSDTAGEKAARLWRKFDAAHIKIEQLVEWMDGGKSNGPWARYFFDLADDAQTREYDFHAAVTAQLQALSDAQSKEWRGSMMDKTAVTLPGIKGPLTRYDLISIALNTGNASNLQRLKDGRGWSDAHIKMVLDELNAEDIAFINGIWNTLESLWPEISALQERVAGVAPPKVAHQAMTVKNGELTGGYFPLVYDPKVSAVGAKQADATASVQDFMARGYGKANTSTGHTKERVENFVAPLMLDFEHVLTSHLSKVIKDISHREAIMGLSKILQNKEIKSAIIDKLGEDHYKLLTTWEQTLISDRADTLHSPLELHNAIFRGLRTHTAIVTMGWKISTMLSQFAGFGPSMDLVKGKYLTAAMIQARLHPKATLEFVQQKSGEMRHRANTIDRDMKDVLLKTRGEHGIMVAVQRSAFFLTGMADRTVSIPTWLGAYNQALADGMSEEDAIRSGDRAVRLSQGSGGAKDLAAVQRNSELMKLLTMYYTPFSVLYARLRDMGHTTKGMRDLPHAAARALVLVILPAVLGELLAGRGPDDDEDKVMWAARKALLYPFATMPVIRDLVNWQIDPALTKLSGGALHFQPGYKLSPVVQAIEKIGGLPGEVIDGMTGDRQWDDVAWDALEASGYMFGLPTAQPRITAEYLTDLWTGSASPEDAGQALHDILFRRPLERNPK